VSAWLYVRAMANTDLSAVILTVPLVLAESAKPNSDTRTSAHSMVVLLARVWFLVTVAPPP